MSDNNSQVSTLNVSILGKDFQVACPADEQEELLQASRLLDKTMREIRDSGKVIGLERIAIMASLNITHDFLKAKDKAEGEQTTAILKKLNRKLDDTLQNAQQLQL